MGEDLVHFASTADSVYLACLQSEDGVPFCHQLRVSLRLKSRNDHHRAQGSWSVFVHTSHFFPFFFFESVTVCVCGCVFRRNNLLPRHRSLALQRLQWVLLQRKWEWGKVIQFLQRFTKRALRNWINDVLLHHPHRRSTGILCSSTQWLSTELSSHVVLVGEADVCCTVEENGAHQRHPVWKCRLRSSSEQSDYHQGIAYPSGAPANLLQLLHDEAGVQAEGKFGWLTT